MQLTQKLNNSQWVAHNIETTDVLPKTMRCSLLGCKAAFIWNHLISDDEKDVIIKEAMQYNNKPTTLEFVERYEGRIEDNVRFVIVTLNPRWETETT